MNCKCMLPGLNAAIGLLLLMSLRAAAVAQNGPTAAHVAIAPISHIVMQGEPIVLRFRVTNNSTEPFCVDFGAESTNWVSRFDVQVQLRDIQSSSVPAIVDYRSKRLKNGSFGYSNHRVAPGKWDEGQFVVTRRLAHPLPGKYRLTVHVDIPCYSGNELPIDQIIQGKSDCVLYADDTIALTILPADPALLQQTAENLRQQAMRPASANQRYDPMHINEPVQALFSMPQEIALPTWRTLLLDPQLSDRVRQRANEELVRLGTVAAGNLLAEVAATLEPRTDAALTTKQKLREFYTLAPDGVKAQLRTTVLAINGSL